MIPSLLLLIPAISWATLPAPPPTPEPARVGLASGPFAVPPLFLAAAARPRPTLDLFAFDMGLAGPTAPAATGAPILSLQGAPGQQPGGDPYWAAEQAMWGGSAGLVFYELHDADFRLGDQRSSWDRAERFELLFHSREPLHGNVEAMVGGFIFWEERDWDEGNAEILFDTWGFGVDAAAMIYPRKAADQRKFNLGLLPYFRLGMGFADGDFRNIPIDLVVGTGTASGDLDNLRFDIGLGIEARAILARKFFAGIGVGWNWWTTAEGAAGTTSNGGIVIITDDEYDFHGDETYVRISGGMFF